MTSLETEVLELIAGKSGTRKEKVSLESTLLGDLGVDGDDAGEILEGLHKRFGVDFSEFAFNRHFRSEPCSKGFLYLFRLLRYRDKHVASRKEPVTVAMLVRACKTKMWKYDV